MLITGIPDERVSSFHHGQVWKSSRGTEYTVVSITGKKAQVRDNRDLKVRHRLWDDVGNWTLVSDPQYPLFKPGAQDPAIRDPNVFPQPGDIFTKGPSRRFVLEVVTTGRHVVIKFYKNIRGNPAFAAPIHTTPWSTWRSWVRHATWEERLDLKEIGDVCNSMCSAYVDYFGKQLRSAPQDLPGVIRRRHRDSACKSARQD
jgi:hypothetical protein